MTKATLKDPLSVSLEIRQHRLLADVTNEQGGTDLGPNPHELLEASLAACTTMTMQMYALRKQWTIGNTETQVQSVTANNETKISRMIRFDSNLPAEQKTRLLEIADRCPIHKLLTGKIEISTTTYNPANP